MTSRVRANAASLMVVVVVVAVGRLILQPGGVTAPPALPGFAPTVAVCVVSPQVRVRPVGLVNEP